MLFFVSWLFIYIYFFIQLRGCSVVIIIIISIRLNELEGWLFFDIEFS